MTPEEKIAWLVDQMGMTYADAYKMVYDTLPPEEEEPIVTPIQKLRIILESINGGVNGEVPNQRISQNWISDTELIYGLRWLENDQPTGRMQRVRVTLEPMDDQIDPPEMFATAPEEPETVDL